MPLPIYRRQPTVWLVLLLFISTLPGCNWSEDAKEAGEKVSKLAQKTWVATRDKATGAWKFVKKKTDGALVVVGAKVKTGKDAIVDGSTAVWLWSKDKATDGWDWIATQTSNATEWASDTSSQMWKVTQEKSGQFFMWVKVEAEEGVAWARTSLPKAWKVSKDAGGKAWVWVNEHKMDVALAATVVAIVVTGLIVAPLGTSTAIVRSAAAKASIAYVGKLYKDNQSKLNGIDEAEFRAMARVVIEQNGEQVLTTRTG